MLDSPLLLKPALQMGEVETGNVGKILRFLMLIVIYIVTMQPLKQCNENLILFFPLTTNTYTQWMMSDLWGILGHSVWSLLLQLCPSELSSPALLKTLSTLGISFSWKSHRRLSTLSCSNVNSLRRATRVWMSRHTSCGTLYTCPNVLSTEWTEVCSTILRNKE